MTNEKEKKMVGLEGGGGKFLDLPPAAWYTVTASPSDSSPILSLAAGPLCGVLCLGQAIWPVSPCTSSACWLSSV